MAEDRWIEASDAISMFATLAWKAQVRPEMRATIDRATLATLAELRSGSPPLEPGQGWQSEQTLHEREAFAGLRDCVIGLGRRVLRFLHIPCDAIEITGCWANVLARGASHRRHAHPNNFLSGVYYVRTPAGADTINFHDPRVQGAVIRPPVVELSAANTDQVVVRVCEGTLLMFPAWLEHSVDANASDEERISVSFNVMFSSFTENLSKPLW
jgi:uncharacterized protein (TIGR02466 family)